MTDFRLRTTPLLGRHRERAVGGRPLLLDVDRRGRFRVLPAADPAAPRLCLLLVPGEGAVAAASGTRGLARVGRRGEDVVWARRVARLAAGGGCVERDLRQVGHLLVEDEASLVGTALAVLNWHDAAGYDPVSGTALSFAEDGWEAHAADRTEFPRTDPAVICLVHDGADHVLLARHAAWPVGRRSVLAGFVEAGESLESAVVREVGEEVGLDVDAVSYLGSQPWPFPRSLMVAFHARADRGRPLRFLDGEISEAGWYGRDEVRAALVADDPVAGGWSRTANGTGALLLPPSISIARGMLEAWVGGC